MKRDVPIARKRDILAVFVRVLGPYIGASLASASVRGHCEKLGLGDMIDRSDVERLVLALSPGLNVFVGRHKAESIVSELHAALSILEGFQ
jgi:hypothetical protein